MLSPKYSEKAGTALPELFSEEQPDSKLATMSEVMDAHSSFVLQACDCLTEKHSPEAMEIGFILLQLLSMTRWTLKSETTPSSVRLSAQN